MELKSENALLAFQIWHMFCRFLCFIYKKFGLICQQKLIFINMNVFLDHENG